MGFICSLCRSRDLPSDGDEHPCGDNDVSPTSNNNIEHSRPKRKIIKPTLFTPSPARKRVNRKRQEQKKTKSLALEIQKIPTQDVSDAHQRDQNKTTVSPVRSILPTSTPEVNESHHQELAHADFSFTESLLNGSFANLQFSPSTFETFDAVLGLPPSMPVANSDINFLPSGINTR